MYLASLCRSRSYITRGMSHLTAMRVSPPLHTTLQASNVSGYLASTSERSFWEHVLLYFLLFSSWNPDPTWVPLIGRAQDTHILVLWQQGGLGNEFCLLPLPSSLLFIYWLSCSTACGILVPWSGIKLAFPRLQDGFLTTGPPGRSCCLSFESRGSVGTTWQQSDLFDSRNLNVSSLDQIKLWSMSELLGKLVKSRCLSSNQNFR